jgi:carbonic anhydrase
MPDSSFTRRRFLTTTALAATAAAFPRFAFASAPPSKYTGDQALHILMQGNARFVSGKLLHPGRKPEDFRPLAAGQTPLAAVLGCADSRVPPEVLFDQGVGDLFTVRVAGNYANGAGASVNGSLEYGVAELNVPLVLVLGHTECGAVKAAIAHLHDDDLPADIKDLVAAIKPAVAASTGTGKELLASAIHNNVQRSVAYLTTEDPILSEHVKSGHLKIAGGVYDLATGKVNLL